MGICLSSSDGARLRLNTKCCPAYVTEKTRPKDDPGVHNQAGFSKRHPDQQIESKSHE